MLHILRKALELLVEFYRKVGVVDFPGRIDILADEVYRVKCAQFAAVQ